MNLLPDIANYLKFESRLFGTLELVQLTDALPGWSRLINNIVSAVVFL
jgi:hypothetical protein